MTKITSKTWKAQLAECATNFGKFRDHMQSLCIFAMNQAASENYTYINDVINGNFKGADLRAIQKYFEDHCDVSLGKEDGKYKFTNNKTRGFKYEAPKLNWWDYKPTAEPKVIDPVSTLLQAVKRVENALNHKGSATIAKGKDKLAKELVAYVKKQPEIFKASKAA